MSRRNNKKPKNNRRRAQNVQRSQAGGVSKDQEPANQQPVSYDPRWLAAAGLAMLAAFAWAYWPTLTGMVAQWIRQPDYSHGFLVLPIALFFLWSRRSTFPRGQLEPSMAGALVLVLGCAIRILAGLFYLSPLDGWTIPLWVAGTVWMLCGWRCLKWSLPAIVFLWFMVPIPFSAERWLSFPLQKLATQLSTAVLLMLGQPALAEGNTVWIGDHQLFIAEACSGLRIFVGVFALAFAIVLFSRWSWWQKVLTLLAAAPVAIIANVGRIVVTALLYQLVSGEAAEKFSHDVAGLVMIPVAAALLFLFLIYLGRLFPEVEEITPMAMVEAPRPGNAI
jgi:exosortase